MRTRDKILYGILVFIVVNVAINYIAFFIKGSYPVEMFIALIPPIITEIFVIFKLGLEDKKNDKSSERINK